MLAAHPLPVGPSGAALTITITVILSKAATQHDCHWEGKLKDPAANKETEVKEGFGRSHKSPLLPRWRCGKESSANARDVSIIPGWRRSLGEGNGTPL